MLKLACSISDALFDPMKIKDYVDDYNSKIDKVPKILKSLFGKERVNIRIMLNNGSLLRVGYETENARIDRVVNGELMNPTIIVLATENAINRIERSNDPVVAFQKERDLGRVDIKGQSLATRVKLDTVLSSTAVLRFFYNIFFA